MKTRRKEAVLVLHARHAVDAPLSHLIKVIEGGCSSHSASVLSWTRAARRPHHYLTWPRRCRRLCRSSRRTIPVGWGGSSWWKVGGPFLDMGRARLCDDEAKARIAFVDSLDQLDAIVSVAELNRLDAVFATRRGWLRIAGGDAARRPTPQRALLSRVVGSRGRVSVSS